MSDEPTRDQLGNEREEQLSEAKQPQAQPDVPGVRSALSSSPERGEEPPEGDAESWGSEGGAGAYKGAPNISEARVPPEGSPRRTWSRAK